MNEVQCREYLDRMGYTGEVAHTPQCLNQLILAHLAVRFLLRIWMSVRII